MRLVMQSEDSLTITDCPDRVTAFICFGAIEIEQIGQIGSTAIILVHQF